MVYDETSMPGRPEVMLSVEDTLVEELGVPLDGVTPALNCTRSKTLRVRRGTRSMVSAPMRAPTVELLVSTKDVLSVTVTTSFTLPTRNVILAVVV